MDMSLSRFRELVMDREASDAAVHGVVELDMTEWLNWTEYPQICITYFWTYKLCIYFSSLF